MTFTQEEIAAYLADGHRCSETAADIITHLQQREKVLEAERNAWRKVAQDQTPGGSEYTSPQYVAEFLRQQRTANHEFKCKAIRREKVLTEACQAVSDLYAFEDGLPGTAYLPPNTARALHKIRAALNPEQKS